MKRNSGFTLLELLTVIAIIAILAGLLTPALISARREAIRAQCISNLKQVGIALHSYALDFNGAFPAGLEGANNLDGYLPAGPPGSMLVTRCPGTAAPGVVYTYIVPNPNNVNNVTPATVMVTCPNDGLHPGPAATDRNYLYGDGHVGPGA